jgi:hypothetical protein
MIGQTPWKSDVNEKNGAKDANKWNNPGDREHCPDFDERHVLKNGVTGANAPSDKDGLKNANCKTEHF